MPGRTYTAGSSYRYGFNGKENDNEVKGNGNHVNFSGRIYDSRIGRFLSVDPMSRSYAGESNYIFAGNSPIQFIDYNGYFKMSSFFVKQYPTLARLIQYYLPTLQGNNQAKEGWIKAIGFNNHAEGEKAFNDMVTEGKGPWITPTRPSSAQKDGGLNQSLSGFFEPTGNAGEWQGTKGFRENITVSHSYLDQLEVSLKKNNANEIGQQMFVVSVLIMHEATHWGKWKYNCCEIEGDDRREMGANFEFNTFGRRFSYNLDKRGFDATKVKSYYSNQNGAYTTPSFGFSINQFSSYWNRIKNAPLGGGQKGDPSLKENGDKEPDSKVFMQSGTYSTGGSGSNKGSYSY